MKTFLAELQKRFMLTKVTQKLTITFWLNTFFVQMEAGLMNVVQCVNRSSIHEWFQPTQACGVTDQRGDIRGKCSREYPAGFPNALFDILLRRHHLSCSRVVRSYFYVASLPNNESLCFTLNRIVSLLICIPLLWIACFYFESHLFTLICSAWVFIRTCSARHIDTFHTEHWQ